MKEKVVKMKPAIEAMKVGESLSFPLLRLMSVRATVSAVAMMMDRRYKTSADKTSRKVNVMRVS